MLAALWLLTHHYRGFVHDGQIYAVEALAKLDPAYASDLFLQNRAQDHFTVFPWLYAGAMRVLGFQLAAPVLSIALTIWFFVMSGKLLREITQDASAWIAVAFLIVTDRAYGAYGVFHYSEAFLTARSLAEAVSVTALYCYWRGLRVWSLLLAAAAMVVHPLMALPILLLLLWQWLPIRTGLIGIGFAGVTVTGITLLSQAPGPIARLFPVIDPAWLEVIRERSQFLFVQLWAPRDWTLNLRPFVTLTLTAIAFPSLALRKLCVGAILIGCAGVFIAFLASGVSPVAIFMQGQAWRWLWVPAYLAALLLIPTAIRLWRQEPCGPLCAIVLVSAWTVAAVNGFACASAALALWLAASRIPRSAAIYCRWAAIIAGAVIVCWVGRQAWLQATLSGSATLGWPGNFGEPIILQRIRDCALLPVLSIATAAGLYWCIRSTRSPWWGWAIASLLLIACACVFPYSLKPALLYGSDEATRAFDDWRDHIPAGSTVFVADGNDFGSFVWFTLRRSNYLSLGQSAGVVFSRATALEVKRRSIVLQPLKDPDWRIYTHIEALRRHDPNAKSPSFRPLTAAKLASVCEDQALGFVIAKESVGFDAVRHTGPGEWHGWNLYDCGLVRESRPKI